MASDDSELSVLQHVSMSEDSELSQDIYSHIKKQNSDFTSIIQDLESNFESKIEVMKKDNAKLDQKMDRILDLLSPGVAARSATQAASAEVETSVQNEVETSGSANVQAARTASRVETPKAVAGEVETSKRKRAASPSSDNDFDRPLQEPPKKKAPSKVNNRRHESQEVSGSDCQSVQSETPAALLSEEAQALLDPSDEADYLEVHADDDEISALLGSLDDGKPDSIEVGEHIAAFVNSRFRRKIITNHAKEFEQMFPVPDNCFNMRVPAVNPPIWKAMPEKHRVCDVTAKNIQKDISLAGAANAKVIADLQKLKERAEGEEAKYTISGIVTTVGNALALIGSAFHGLNNKRKKDIKPCLNPSLAELCAESNPVSPEWLFGDYLSSSVREIQDERRVTSQIARASSSSFSQRGQRGRFRGKQTGNNKQFSFNFSQSRGGSSGQNDRRPRRGRGRGRGQYRGRGGYY